MAGGSSRGGVRGWTSRESEAVKHDDRERETQEAGEDTNDDDADDEAAVLAGRGLVRGVGCLAGGVEETKLGRKLGEEYTGPVLRKYYGVLGTDYGVPSYRYEYERPDTDTDG
ncbi:glycerol-3-phosphate dehydrogenase, partial [Lasius niger]